MTRHLLESENEYVKHVKNKLLDLHKLLPEESTDIFPMSIRRCVDFFWTYKSIEYKTQSFSYEWIEIKMKDTDALQIIEGNVIPFLKIAEDNIGTYTSYQQQFQELQSYVKSWFESPSKTSDSVRAMSGQEDIQRSNGELQKYDMHTAAQEITNHNKTYTSREDKKKLMVDLISAVHALCRHASLQSSPQRDCKGFAESMQLIYEKVLRKSPNGYTSLNYALSEQLTIDVQYFLNKSYDIFLKCRHFFHASLESAVIFLNTVMNRLDDGKEWQVVMRSGCWWMEGRDGTMQQITIENPMLEVAYTSTEDKYSFVKSFVQDLERKCQCQYALIPDGDAYMHDHFQKFHDNVREIEENPRRLVELCYQTCENWSQIEPMEIDDLTAVPPDLANLIDISAAVRLLWCLADDLKETNQFVWVIKFKFRNWDIQKEYIGRKNKDHYGRKALLDKLQALC